MTAVTGALTGDQAVGGEGGPTVWGGGGRQTNKLDALHRQHPGLGALTSLILSLTNFRQQSNKL